MARRSGQENNIVYEKGTGTIEEVMAWTSIHRRKPSCIEDETDELLGKDYLEITLGSPLVWLSYSRITL